jgi:hypothetical protein
MASTNRIGFSLIGVSVHILGVNEAVAGRHRYFNSALKPNSQPNVNETEDYLPVMAL